MMAVGNCRLCKIRPADKKGSHIVPHFLLKRIENVGGKTGRDYELGFAIGEFDTTAYFGRSVSPDQLDETFGELTDDDLAVNKHPLVVDHYFCSYCEERLSHIESEYSKTLGNFKLEADYPSGAPGTLGLVFWASIFWRMSIHQQSGTYLIEPENEVLRIFLDKFLSTVPTAAELTDVKMTYRIIRCPNYSDGNVTHLSWHPVFRKGYALMIDEFVVVLSPTDDYSEFDKHDFIGLNTEVKSSPKNLFSGKEIVRPITAAAMETAKSKLAAEAAAKRLERLNEFWDKFHRAIGGHGTTMPSFIKQEILNELNSEEKKMGRKHTRREIEACTMRVVMRHSSK